MKKIVGIDIADTIIDVWPSLIRYAEYYNSTHSNNPKSKNKHLYLPEDIFSWNQEEKKEFWSIYRDNVTFNSPIKEGVKETLEYLKELGYDIWLITVKTDSEYENLENKIINYLKKNGIIYDKVITQVLDKGLFCFKNNISYFIDDSYKNCLGAAYYRINVFLLNNYYNEDRELVDSMKRINRIDEVKKYIKR